MLEEAAKLAGNGLAPLNRDGDKVGAKLENGVVRTAPGFTGIYKEFVDGGWNSLPFDPEFGGQGMPWLLATTVQEMWQAANMGFGLVLLLNQGAIDAIHHHGSAEQKAAYLPKMISGEWTGTMNLTEPQAGSDLGQLKSRAVKNGDHYLITGQKIFITYGEHDLTENIVHLVLARTPDAPAGVRGISLFIVPKFLPDADGKPGKRNDLRCVSLEHKLGIHASPTCVMSFGDDGGAVGYLVGEEGRGLSYMFTMMNNARLSVGIQGLAIAERAYQQAADFAKTRVQSKDDGSAEAAAGLDRPSPRRPPHADDHARPDRGDARAGLLHRRRHRRRAAASRQGDGAQDAGPRRPADPDREGVVHRPRQRDRLDRRADPWRHGLHRGDRRRPAPARRAHPADLRGHQRHPGARPGRPQGRQGRRRDHAGAGRRDARPGRGAEGGAGRRPRGDPRRRRWPRPTRWRTPPNGWRSRSRASW